MPESERRVGSCYSIYNLLPKHQEGREEQLERFRKLLADKDEYIDRLDDKLKEQVKAIKESLASGAVTLEDVPYALTKHFEDLKRNKGVVVFVNPRPGMLLSDGRNLTKFADTIKEFTLPDGRVFHAAGSMMIFSDLVRAIRDQAPLLTLASFVCVILFVWLVVRRWRASWIIVISLALGII